MTTIGFRVSSVSALAAAAFMAGVATAPAQETFTLAHMFPTNHMQGKPYELWAKLVTERSGGRIKVVTHPASSLISGREAFNAVREDAVQGSNMTSPFQVGSLPILNAISLPFMFENHEHFRHALKAGLFDIVAKAYEEKGIKLLWYSTKGSAHIFHRSKFLITPADFKGANLRGLGGYMTLMLKEFGANAVTLPTGEVTTALQRGVVDGILTSCIAHIARGWVEEARYVSAVDVAESAEGLGVNLDFFNKQPADLQKIMIDAGKEAGDLYWSSTMHADAVKCPADWKRLNLPVRIPTPAQRQALREAAKSLYDKALKEVPHAAEIIAIAEKTR